jgi:hypothetical protein
MPVVVVSHLLVIVIELVKPQMNVDSRYTPRK